MEFEEEEEEHEEEEEEDDGDEVAITPTSFKPGPTNERKPITSCRYRECLKNHAVGSGGHAIDGCGEFMPAGGDGTVDAFKCAACNCHRNFHRKEILLEAASHHQNQLAIYGPHFHYRTPPPHVNYQFYPYSHRSSSSAPGSFIGPRPLCLPSPTNAGGAHGGEQKQEVEEEGGMTLTMTSGGKKRHRTKFTQEQKGKMLEFAEKLEWKIQKQDETAVLNFCNETGLKRHVLKVWMHNNKHTLSISKKP